jgi:FtsZ-binding cell division protein ZapB
MEQYYKIINNETKEVTVGVVAREEDKQIFLDDGFTFGEVEQGYDGQFYVAGYEPQMPESVRASLRIEELKDNLASTDYQAIKYAEGQITEEDYAPIKAQRQAWREEINELEGVLESAV